MNPFFIIILLGTIGVLGDFFMKLAGSGEKSVDVKWFLIAFFLYASTSFGWLYVMKRVELSSIGAIYSLVTILLLVLIGVFYFHERVNGYELAGIIMAV